MRLLLHAQGLVFRLDGALGVGLVNAVRGATVAIASGLLFCRPDKPGQCLSMASATSAAVVTAGGIVWVCAGNRARVSGKSKTS
jgi:hypothetical protein